MTWEELEKYAMDNGASKIYVNGYFGFQFNTVRFFQDGPVEAIALGPDDDYTAYLGNFEYQDMKTILELLIKTRKEA